MEKMFMFVSLDPVSRQDALIKKTPGGYMEKTVRSLVEYMLDPNGDSLNSGYNQSERETIDIINDWMRGAEVNQWDEFILEAALADGGTLPLDLDEVVKTYENRIMKRVQVSKENPSGIPYLDLFASFSEAGH